MIHLLYPIASLRPKNMNDWIRNREIHGLVTFSIDDARKAFPEKSETTLKTAIGRAIRAGRIQNVRSGFYVIVPPQYVLKGIIPPSYYIDALMEWLGKPYYVCLLSAANMFGAGHQRPMQTQVMTVAPKSRTSGINTQIQWNYRQSIPEPLILQTNTEAGIMKYSSAELTAVDLVQFADHVGGYQRAATVLAELVESMDINKIHAVMPYTSIATVQRMGYLLEYVLEEKDKADELYTLLKEESKNPKLITMRSDMPRQDDYHKNRWHINMNTDIETDEI